MSRIGARASKWLPIFVVLVGVAFFYAPSLNTGYFADDFDYAVRHAAREPLSYTVTRNTDGTLAGGSWRPLAALSYWLTMRADSPFIDHTVSLVLYLVVVALVYAIARAWFPEHSTVSAAIIAAIFGVLPSHVEPVVWVAARADLLASIGALAAVLLWIKNHRWLALIGFAASLLSKELWVLLGFVLPFMTIFSFDSAVIKSWRNRYLWYTSLIAIILGWLIVRYLITGYGAGGYSITSEQQVLSAQHLANELIAFAVGIWSFGETQSLLIRFSQYYWFIMAWVIALFALMFALRARGDKKFRAAGIGLCATLAPTIMLSIPMITPAASVGEQRYWFAPSFFAVLLFAHIKTRELVFFSIPLIIVFAFGTVENIGYFQQAATHRDQLLTAWRAQEQKFSTAAVYGLPDSWHGVHLFASPFFERALQYHELMEPKKVSDWYQWCGVSCATQPATVHTTQSETRYESAEPRIFSKNSGGLRYSIRVPAPMNTGLSQLFWTGTDWIFVQARPVENRLKPRY